MPPWQSGSHLTVKGIPAQDILKYSIFQWERFWESSFSVIFLLFIGMWNKNKRDPCGGAPWTLRGAQQFSFMVETAFSGNGEFWDYRVNEIPTPFLKDVFTELRKSFFPIQLGNFLFKFSHWQKLRNKRSAANRDVLWKPRTVRSSQESVHSGSFCFPSMPRAVLYCECRRYNGKSLM